jgi:hypothetical protein
LVNDLLHFKQKLGLWQNSQSVGPKGEPHLMQRGGRNISDELKSSVGISIAVSKRTSEIEKEQFDEIEFGKQFLRNPLSAFKKQRSEQKKGFRTSEKVKSLKYNEEFAKHSIPNFETIEKLRFETKPFDFPKKEIPKSTSEIVTFEISTDSQLTKCIVFPK